MGAVRRILDLLHRRRHTLVKPPLPDPPSWPRRHVVLDPASPVRAGEELVHRVIAESRRIDPLELRRESFDFEGETREQRVADLICAALGGTLPIDERHPRAILHPVTREILRASGVEPDAFAALAAIRIGSGLYIDGPLGRTLAKAVYVDNMSYDRPAYPHVRTRILDPRDNLPRITWWQHEDGRFQLMVPMLPATIVTMLVGEPLSTLMANPAEGEHNLIIQSIEDYDHEDEGPRSLIWLAERDKHGP